MTRSKRQTNPAQANRFIEAARQVGADDDETTFKAKLAAIAQHKPKGDVPPAPEPDSVEN